MTERDFDEMVLDSFLNEMHWDNLKLFITSRSSLKKKFSAGGFKLQKKNLGWARSVISKHCAASGYDSLFLLWYDKQSKYAELLNPYFESEEYVKWAEESYVAVDKYALPDTMFDEFFNILEPCHALWFLYLSPMVFEPDQEQRILTLAENSSANVAVIDENDDALNAKGLEKELKATQKQNIKLNKELENLRNEVEKLKQKNIRLGKRVSVPSKEDNVSEIRLNSELFECKEQLAEWENLLKKKDSELTKRSTEKEDRDRQIKNLKKKLERFQDDSVKHFTRILGFLDSEKFLFSLNASDDVREVLETVVRPPGDDGVDEALLSADNFGKFWKELMDREWAIAEGFLSLDVENVASGKYFQAWPDRKDEFNDLKYLLSTRLFLAQMLHEILRQYYQRDSLPEEVCSQA
jgi:hypothetical protein